MSNPHKTIPQVDARKANKIGAHSAFSRGPSRKGELRKAIRDFTKTRAIPTTASANFRLYGFLLAGDCFVGMGGKARPFGAASLPMP
jgi:hypothetical protein